MVLWMIPAGTNFSAVDSPGGTAFGGNTYSMTGQLSRQGSLGSHTFLHTLASYSPK